MAGMTLTPNKPFNENTSKQRWHGLTNYVRPLTGR
jgi:hypothetical protein